MAFYEDILNGLTRVPQEQVPAFGALSVPMKAGGPQPQMQPAMAQPAKLMPETGGFDDLATFLAGMGEGGGALLPALGSGMRAVSGEKERRGRINETYNFLVKKGMDPDTAKAVMGNPELLKLELSKIYKPAAQPEFKEVGGRLVRILGDEVKEVYSPPQSQALGPYKDAKQVADVEEGLRKEHTTAAKEFTIIRDGLRRVKTGASMDSGAGDLAVVYGYMKMLDPGSVVREGEFATAEQTTGVPSYIVNLYNKIVNGDRLPAGAREKFSAASQALYDNAFQQYDQTRRYYEDLAKRKELDPRNVIMDPSSAPPAPAAPKRAEDMSNEELLLELNKGAR